MKDLPILQDKPVNIIYSMGAISRKCINGFCPHNQVDRYSASVTLIGAKVMTENRQRRREPCHGAPGLECGDSLICYHENNNNPFARDDMKFGVCVDQQFFEPDDGTEDSSGKQLVFANGGGYENELRLPGGFVLLWTVNYRSGYDDTLSCALVSTKVEYQGWIGLGFSPTGALDICLIFRCVALFLPAYFSYFFKLIRNQVKSKFSNLIGLLMVFTPQVEWREAMLSLDGWAMERTAS